jgi:hypothetical protein
MSNSSSLFMLDFELVFFHVHVDVQKEKGLSREVWKR